MPYQINEGQFDFDSLDDSSINVLEIPAREDGTPLRLVITRDALGPGEDLQTCLTRQVRELSRSLPEFAEIKREAGWLGSGEAIFPAIVLHTLYKQDGQQVHQAQCVAQISDARLLILTLTSPHLFDDKLRARWVELLTRFVPSPAFAPAQADEET
ncbi:MAG: DUF1795 domain-containing protein [Betaproteobacteria bacterium]|nr:DUF1795 domain-containing protein [Betaproteobacteria bacterium]